MIDLQQTNTAMCQEAVAFLRVIVQSEFRTIWMLAAVDSLAHLTMLQRYPEQMCFQACSKQIEFYWPLNFKFELRNL